MSEYLYIGIGGMIGAVLRYLVSISLASFWMTPFPLGTLLINYIGTFCLVVFHFRATTALRLPKPIVTAISTGLIGSFTTFSTFSVETMQLTRQSEWILVFLYVFLSIIGGLIMAYLGYRVGKGD
ncbi:fluoride efflux transporter CrcB [Salirhabdus sp. Marseille-P4669]|uniref:fluoride efflux transporter CrcB n=1 Tax=Salirhabdus sp. Marseille-P4669 TaxID=2042310 RepID=UPI000C7C533E|nr:fluoride efflux transporter CrcB [Salirhabdus sp. Marseille-P4669]